MIAKINAKTIAIEGTDCSGKETHAKLLAKNLNAKFVSFPRYDNPISYPVKRWLSRKYDSALMSYIYLSTIYYVDMIDFQSSSRDEYNFDNENQIIVFDRHIFSNIIYQSMHGIKDITDRNKATIISRMSKIFELGLKMGMIVPDHTIILTGSIKELESKKDKDSNETFEFQERVYKNLDNFMEWIIAVYKYHPACKGKTFDLINMCDTNTGEMNTIEHNQNRILTSVKNSKLGV